MGLKSRLTEAQASRRPPRTRGLNNKGTESRWGRSVQRSLTQALHPLPDSAPRTYRLLFNFCFQAPGHNRAGERHIHSQGRVLGAGPFSGPADTQCE